VPERRRPCGKCGKNRAERFFTPRGRICMFCKRDKRRRSTKDRRLNETYGISMEDYDRILALQGGKCAICKGTRKVYDVDHDHAAERDGLPTRMTVRGLLCRRCNKRLLPASKDDVQILANAIVYLQRPPARRLLLSG